MTALVRPRAVADGRRFRYRSYGLVIDSGFELSGLPAAEDGPGEPSQLLTIVRTQIDDPAIAERDPMIFVNRGDEQLLAWAMVGAFRIPSDDRIEVDPNEGAADSLIALPLLGAVLATLLHRRGLIVFHASAVAVHGVAVALLGDKGAGKSTTAGALIAAGHSLIADDIVALDYGTIAGPRVLPAFGQLKLWDDSGSRLREAGITRIGRLHDKVDKAHYALTDRVSSEPMPVGRVYVLGRSETPGVTRLGPSDALSLLLRHSYMARFGHDGFGGAMATYFQRAGRLVNEGRVRALEVPASLDEIDRIPGLVEADLAAGTVDVFT